MSKYNVGDKFIIEISKNDTNELDNTEYYITNARIIFEKEELDRLQKYEEEQIPYSEAYNKGLKDAWEFVRKIFTFNNNKMKEIFGVAGKRSVFDDLSPQVALVKLEIYEKKQNIKVGDIIICCDKEGVVTKVDDNYFNIIYEDGSSDKISQIICKEKTGKHIDIQSILQQIGGGIGEN